MANEFIRSHVKTACEQRIASIKAYRVKLEEKLLAPYLKPYTKIAFWTRKKTLITPTREEAVDRFCKSFYWYSFGESRLYDARPYGLKALAYCMTFLRLSTT